MDRQMFRSHVLRLSPDEVVDMYYPIIEEMRHTISNQSRELEDLKKQKEEQDKHYDKLLSRIKSIATE